MKVIEFKLFKYIKNFVNLVMGVLLWFCKKKSKLKTGDEENRPISIHIDSPLSNGDYKSGHIYPSETIPSSYNRQNETKANLIEWTEWTDNYEATDTNIDDIEDMQSEVDLFRDMEPVISKPKMVRLKKKNLDNQLTSNVGFNRFGIDADGFHIESELGNWVDEPSGWDQADIDETEISRESQRLAKEKKMAEREQRALEQIRKKEEREAARAQKKVTSHLGVKLG